MKPRKARSKRSWPLYGQICWAQSISAATTTFFHLGGDSIISIQVVSRLQQAGYHVRPRDIFMHQTIAALATAIAGQHNSQ